MTPIGSRSGLDEPFITLFAEGPGTRQHEFNLRVNASSEPKTIDSLGVKLEIRIMTLRGDGVMKWETPLTFGKVYDVYESRGDLLPEWLPLP